MVFRLSRNSIHRWRWARHPQGVKTLRQREQPAPLSTRNPLRVERGKVRGKGWVSLLSDEPSLSRHSWAGISFRGGPDPVPFRHPSLAGPSLGAGSWPNTWAPQMLKVLLFPSPCPLGGRPGEGQGGTWAAVTACRAGRVPYWASLRWGHDSRGPSRSSVALLARTGWPCGISPRGA